MPANGRRDLIRHLRLIR